MTPVQEVIILLQQVKFHMFVRVSVDVVQGLADALLSLQLKRESRLRMCRDRFFASVSF